MKHFEISLASKDTRDTSNEAPVMRHYHHYIDKV